MTTKEQIVSLMFDPIEVPLEWKENGQALRVRGTRIPLETIIHRRQAGDTPEDIQEGFPTLRLDDIYAVLTFYLRNQVAVDKYVAEQDQQADDLRQQIEAEQGSTNRKEILLARWAELQQKKSE